MQTLELFISALPLRSQRMFTLSLAEGCVGFFFLRKLNTRNDPDIMRYA
jgi:hypothetical protein